MIQVSLQVPCCYLHRSLWSNVLISPFSVEGYAEGHLSGLIIRNCSGCSLVRTDLKTISGVLVDGLLVLTTSQVRNFVNKFLLVLKKKKKEKKRYKTLPTNPKPYLPLLSASSTFSMHFLACLADTCTYCLREVVFTQRVSYWIYCSASRFSY